MFTESSFKSHYLTAVQIYDTSVCVCVCVCVNLCTLLASKVSLPSHTMRMIFLYNISRIMPYRNFEFSNQGA